MNKLEELNRTYNRLINNIDRKIFNDKKEILEIFNELEVIIIEILNS